MKNVLISLLALAAVSGAALASDSVDLRDSDTYFGKYSTQHQAAQSYATKSNAFAVANDGAALTAFERMMKISEENQSGHGNNVSRSRPQVK
jgi:hypothetical protein